MNFKVKVEWKSTFKDFLIMFLISVVFLGSFFLSIIDYKLIAELSEKDSLNSSTLIEDMFEPHKTIFYVLDMITLFTGFLIVAYRNNRNTLIQMFAVAFLWVIASCSSFLFDLHWWKDCLYNFVRLFVCLFAAYGFFICLKKTVKQSV